jgi:tetratricopeptide (TPR) repeat protein
MRKLSVLLGAIGIFLLGAMVSFMVTRNLYYSGRIFTEKSIPNPVFEATKLGHYDEAIKLALTDVNRDPNNWFGYEQVVTVYLMRAYKDEPHREEWVQQALSYIDKMVSLAPKEPANLFSAGYNYERAGDLSKNGCPSYEKAAQLCHNLNSLLQADSLMVKDWKFPTKPLRRDNDALSKRVAVKLESWCSVKGAEVPPSGLR